MFKFLRKYNKWILAVGGTLLMVVFLVPQAIRSLSQRAAVGNAVWATIGDDGEEVPVSERRRCEVELEVLENLSRAGYRIGIADKPEHWYLLVREADEAGLLGGRARDQLPPEILNSLAGRVESSQALDQALSKTFAVGRMFDLYQRAGKLSDNRVRADAERLFHSVDGRAIVLVAEADDAPAAPTESEINAQFEKYRDLSPGGREANLDPDQPDAEIDFPEENVAGFGYKLPDRFKIEWLRVSRDSVRKLIEASDELNDIALIMHWKRNQQAKGFPEVDENAATIPDRVRDDLLDELVTAKLDAIRKFISDRLLASWRRLKAPEGYYELPADWADRRVKFPALAEAVQTEFTGLDLPSYQAVGDRWLTLDDLADLEGLAGSATDKYAAGTTDIRALVAATKEFGGNPTILIQQGVAGPVLADRIDSSLVAFRITATDPTRAPKDIDEVRDLVVEDLRRQAAYEKLVADLPGLESTARDEGILAAAIESDADLQQLSVSLYSPQLAQFQLQNNMPLRAMPNALPVIGQNKKASEAIIDDALALPRDKPLQELDRAQRIMGIAIPEKMAVMVVEIEGQRPLDRDRFNQLASSQALQKMLVSKELTEVKDSLAEVFTYDVMKARHNFHVKARERADDSDAPPEANAGAEKTATAESSDRSD